MELVNYNIKLKFKIVNELKHNIEYGIYYYNPLPEYNDVITEYINKYISTNRPAGAYTEIKLKELGITDEDHIRQLKLPHDNLDKILKYNINPFKVDIKEEPYISIWGASVNHPYIKKIRDIHYCLFRLGIINYFNYNMERDTIIMLDELLNNKELKQFINSLVINQDIEVDEEKEIKYEKLMKLNDEHYRIGCNCSDKGCDFDLFLMEDNEEPYIKEMYIYGDLRYSEFEGNWVKRLLRRIKDSLKVLFKGYLEVHGGIILDEENIKSLIYVLGKFKEDLKKQKRSHSTTN